MSDNIREVLMILNKASSLLVNGADNRAVQGEIRKAMNKLQLVISSGNACQTALTELIADLEMRANLKSGRKKGVVECGHGVYIRAKHALGQEVLKLI